MCAKFIFSLKENCQAIFQSGCTIWNWFSLPPPFSYSNQNCRNNFHPKSFFTTGKLCHIRKLPFCSSELVAGHYRIKLTYVQLNVGSRENASPLTTGPDRGPWFSSFSILGLWLWNTLSVLLTRSQRTNPQLSELCFLFWLYLLSCFNAQPSVAQMVKNCLQRRRPRFNPCFGKIP